MKGSGEGNYQYYAVTLTAAEAIGLGYLAISYREAESCVPPLKELNRKSPGQIRPNGPKSTPILLYPPS